MIVHAFSPHEVVIDGVRLAYDDQGAGPAVVCLHAIGHDAHDFRRLRARLASRCRVIALDWPGHGRSGSDQADASGSRYAALLAEFLDGLGVARAVIVGNSVGGEAALRYAHRHPERVRGLVLENPGGLARNSDRLAQTVLGLMARFFAAGVRRARWFPAAFRVYYRLCVLQRRAARADRRRIVGRAYESAPVLLQAWRSFARPEADARDLAPAITCPVLFAWARRDQFVQLRRSAAAIRRFPDARVQTFRAGHAPHLETPDELESAVEAFLAQLPP